MPHDAMCWLGEIDASGVIASLPYEIQITGLRLKRRPGVHEREAVLLVRDPLCLKAILKELVVEHRRGVANRWNTTVQSERRAELSGPHRALSIWRIETICSVYFPFGGLRQLFASLADSAALDNKNGED